MFRVAQDGTETVLHSFTGVDDSGANADGMEPWAGLTLGKDGNFYGVTTAGGANACGTMFQISPAGAFKVVHAFAPAAGGSGDGFGGSALSLAADASGSLYGISFCNEDVFFRYSMDGNFTPVHTFSNGEVVPTNGIAFGKDGNLYGSSMIGNVYGDPGTVSRITTDGVYTLLYSFTDMATSGEAPSTVPVQGVDGNLYGIVNVGGAHGNGLIYRLAPDGNFSVAHAFDAASKAERNLDGDNAAPFSIRSLTMGSDGALYGSLENGGLNAGGTKFALGVDGSYATLVSSDASLVGSAQGGKLLEDANGNFYGAAGIYGSTAGGAIFKVVPHSGTSVNVSVNHSSVTAGKPVKLSWTSTNAAGCTLAGDLSKKLQGTSVPPSGSKLWVPLRSGRAIVGVKCMTSDGGEVNASQAVSVN